MYRPRTFQIVKGTAKFEVANNCIFKRYWQNNIFKQPYKFLKDVVPVDKLKIDAPVSGSLNWDDMSKSREFVWDAASLNHRGFLRFQKEYSPPAGAKERILKLSLEVVGDLKGNNVETFVLSDPKIKFEILSKAFEEFDHSPPNSMLYLMKTVGDVAKFYSTPISTVTPYDTLVNKRDELPPNLHVQKEPLRFHPDTDTMFGGMTAFPKSTNIVTGLRAKKKYKGFEAKRQWP